MPVVRPQVARRRGYLKSEKCGVPPTRGLSETNQRGSSGVEAGIAPGFHINNRTIPLAKRALTNTGGPPSSLR
jgi:hypothetical protein